MRVLVTGGAGFVGSHLCQSLLQQGNSVVALDDFSTGRRSNIQHLSANKGFQAVPGSVLDEEVLRPLITDADVVYHLAASVGVGRVVNNLVETIETNVHGTATLIKLASKHGNIKVILASTSEVYGKSTNIPFKEDNDVVLGPTSIGRWGYAGSKMLDELLALAYHKEADLPVVVLRLFNTIGPRQTGEYGMVVPRFVSQALKRAPITVHGDGGQSRCFTYVGDVVKAMIDISRVDAANGQVINLGNDQEITMKELAILTKSTLDSDSEIVFVPYNEVYGTEFEDMRRRVPDISKIRRYIDYNPSTDLAQIILEVAEALGQSDPIPAPESGIKAR